MTSWVCVDDYGEAVYVCRYTGVLCRASEAVVVGGTAPNVKARYVMANTSKARQARRQRAAWFHLFEANCNTCRHLERVKHEKNRDGFLRGRCLSPAPCRNAHPYAHLQEGEVMWFHPEDAMLMPCYESRWRDE